MDTYRRWIAFEIVGVIAGAIMLTALASITASLLTLAAAFRALRSVENQALLAVQAGKALWLEVGSLLKN